MYYGSPLQNNINFLDFLDIARVNDQFSDTRYCWMAYPRNERQNISVLLHYTSWWYEAHKISKVSTHYSFSRESRKSLSEIIESQTNVYSNEQFFYSL